MSGEPHGLRTATRKLVGVRKIEFVRERDRQTDRQIETDRG